MQTINHLENIIEVKNLYFSYGDREVLNDINFAIHKGDYLGVVGSNGAGKTTLLKIMLGLLKADGGSIKLFGQDILSFKNWSKIGYVPQKVINFDNNFPVTVLEVVLMGRYGKIGLFNKIKKEDRDKALEALGKVGMLDYANRSIGDLSGGQQQRVFIARALSGQPEILFLDEPTVGVEKDVRDKFYELLKTLNTEFDLTIVIITHDIKSMSHEAMHVACINNNTLVFHDSLDDLFIKSHGLNN